MSHSTWTPCARASRRPASKFSGVRSDATTVAPASAARIATFVQPSAAFLLAFEHSVGKSLCPFRLARLLRAFWRGQR